MTQVAVYGTLRQRDSRAGALSSATFKGMARLPSNIALFDYGAFPFIKEVDEPVENQVVCEVYDDIDAGTLRLLDSIEGHPRFYERRLVSIQGHGDCWVYFLDSGDGPQITSGDWHERD